MNLQGRKVKKSNLEIGVHGVEELGHGAREEADPLSPKSLMFIPLALCLYIKPK